MTLRHVWPVVVAAWAAGGCASLHVGSYTAPGAGLAHMRTYGWAVVDGRPTGDARLDSNRFFHEALRRSVDGHLARRGLELETAGTPDVLVGYHVNVTQRIRPRSREPLADEPCRECGPDVYDSGWLVLDFVDPLGATLVWRGWIEGAIDGVIDDQAWMEQRIDEGVARILRELPDRAPRPAAARVGAPVVEGTLDDRVAAGRDLFRTHCASCHGSDGRGGGATAGQHIPPDLTMFAARNHGAFPAERLRRMIDGRGPAAHGGREMPVWGEAFKRREGLSEAQVRQQVDALIDYLRAIQERATR